LQPAPSPLCDLASWPLLGACSMNPGESLLLKNQQGTGEREERNAYAPHLRTCTQPAKFLLLVGSLQPTLSPLRGLALWPLLGAYSMYPGKQFLILNQRNKSLRLVLLTASAPT